MSRKKITGILVCAGLGVGLFAGGYSAFKKISVNATNNSVTSTRTAYTAEVGGKTYSEGMQPFGEMRPDNFGGKFGFGNEFTEEQLAAFETYQELSREIHQKYRSQHEALISAFNAEIEEAYKTVLGDSYTEMLAEKESLSSQYSSLVNGFYNSSEYVALKAELDGLIAEIVTLDKNSDEYKAIKEEINVVWGKISMLAGETNSEISLIHLRSAELSKEIKALMEQNKAALDEIINPIISQFQAEAKVIQTNLMQELDLLRQTLGI